jgi:hypothetical protein
VADVRSQGGLRLPLPWASRMRCWPTGPAAARGRWRWSTSSPPGGPAGAGAGRLPPGRGDAGPPVGPSAAGAPAAGRRVRKSRAWPLSCPFPCQRGYRAPGPQRHLETISRAAQTRLPHAVPLHPDPRPARPRRRRQGPWRSWSCATSSPSSDASSHDPGWNPPTAPCSPRPAASCHATAGRASSSPRTPCGAGIAWSPACGPTRTAATDDHRWTTTYSS